METGTYIARRGQLETYFDRTAVEAWAKLTTDAPVSKIRATVRAGRDQIRNTLLSWLPQDLTGVTILDAGCGTGALSIEAARRGADVTAIDLSPTLVELARERAPTDLAGTVAWLSGDMLSPDLGSFDHVVGMDSMIHYKAADMAAMLAGLAKRTRKSILFTHAPRTPMLTVMHAVGRMFPQGNRAPFIEPISNTKIRQLFLAHPENQGWSTGRDLRVTTGFYMSHAQELVVR
jgi:magnesium-protoporphyrin O-methyltransferase